MEDKQANRNKIKLRKTAKGKRENKMQEIINENTDSKAKKSGRSKPTLALQN
jgi:hypothetical protein